MSDFLIYITQVSLCLAILYALYYLFFRKLTFHKTNRLLLLFLLPISLCLPFLNLVEITIPSEAIILTDFDDLIALDVTTELARNDISEYPKKHLNLLTSLFSIYILGASISLIRLFSSIKQPFRLKKRSQTFTKDGNHLIKADIPNIFSCFNWIFISKDRIHEIDPLIIEHEKVHVKLWHTLDLLLIEIYLVIFWFNPFAYFFRISIRSIHEFQADKYVVDNQIKKSYYLELLLKNLGAKQTIKLHSYFNHSLIKKRIDMITKTNSNQKNSIRYILLVPVLAILFMAFIKPEFHTNPSHVIEQVITEEITTDTTPSIFPVKNGSKQDITAMYGKNFNHPILKKKVIHWGIDIRAKIGTPIVATADGVISNAKNEGDWGNLIIISHPDGYETWYAHLDSFDTKKNQQVKKGQVIGYSGNTGLSTGPHLHYEVKFNGKRVNPMNFIKD